MHGGKFWVRIFVIDKLNDLISWIAFKSGLGHLFLMSAGGGVGHELEKGATQTTSESNEWNKVFCLSVTWFFVFENECDKVKMSVTKLLCHTHFHFVTLILLCHTHFYFVTLILLFHTDFHFVQLLEKWISKTKVIISAEIYRLSIDRYTQFRAK